MSYLKKNSLKNVYEILEKITAEPKRLEKEKIIQSNLAAANFKEVVFFALDYTKMYNITQLNEVSKGKKKYKVADIFKYLDYLSNKSGTSDNEKLELSTLAYSIDPETVDVVNRIVQKDLRCGASVKTFKKFFPELPYFEMMTCKADVNIFLKNSKKLNTDVFISDKKDGVRTWGRVGKYISRSGLEYHNFNIFNNEIFTLINFLKERYNVPDDVFLDGEVTVEGGNFQEVMRNVRTLEENQDEDNPVNYIYNIFDIVLLDKTLKERIKMLEDVFNNHGFLHLRLLKHRLIKQKRISAAVFEKEMNNAVQRGEEGIVVKMADSPYELKERSKYWLKMKPTETYDLLVVGKFNGQGRLKGTLGGLVVKFNDQKVKVGSGYTDEERQLFMTHQPKIIEVKCKGITEDGKLREPIFVRIRDDKSTVTDEQ